MEKIKYSIENYTNHYLYFFTYTPRASQFVAFNRDKITLLIDDARLDSKINVERGFIVLDYLNKAWLL